MDYFHPMFFGYPFLYQWEYYYLGFPFGISLIFSGIFFIKKMSKCPKMQGVSFSFLPLTKGLNLWDFISLSFSFFICKLGQCKEPSGLLKGRGIGVNEESKGPFNGQVPTTGSWLTKIIIQSYRTKKSYFNLLYEIIFVAPLFLCLLTLWLSHTWLEVGSLSALEMPDNVSPSPFLKESLSTVSCQLACTKA